MLNKPLYTGNANCVLIAPFQVKGHCSVPLHTALYHVYCHKRCHMRSMVYLMSCDPISSNQMTGINIGVT